MSPAIEREYVAVIRRVLEYVQIRLDDDLSPRALAEVAGYSSHHFHRLFRAVTGESVMDHVRRLRLERAALKLRKSDLAIGEVAAEAGYFAQEVFTRAFQMYYGMSPRSYKMSSLSHLLPAPNGIHAENSAAIIRLSTAVAPELIRKDGFCLCPFHRAEDSDVNDWSAWTLDRVFGIAEVAYPFDRFRLFREESRMTTTQTIDEEIESCEKQLDEAKKRLTEARHKRPREEVVDYVLADWDGKPVRLSEAFGDKEDLIVIHNMGTGCSYCTMWADGFTGLVPHLSDRASFVVISPDAPDVQKRFAEKRNWNFRMLSTHDSPFNHDMGFQKEEGPWPGVSTFRKDADGKIYRISKAFFGPGDDFCVVWPFLDLLEQGAGGWEPKYYYGEKK